MYEDYKTEFADADVTFFYNYLVKQAITDETGGWHDIKDWHVTPTRIAFTMYNGMENDTDDGYGGGYGGSFEDFYTIKIRYYFVANNQGEWTFVSNEYIGFAAYEY